MKKPNAISQIFCKIIRIPSQEDSWPLIEENASAFFWTDSDIEEFWSCLALSEGYDPIRVAIDQAEKMHISYKDKHAEINLTGTRQDRTASILALANVISDDFTVLYCKDSWHSSDLAFLVLPNEIFTDTVNSQKATKINKRFIVVDHDLHRFETEAFSEKNQNLYIGDELTIIVRGTSMPSPADWETWFKKLNIDVGWRHFSGEQIPAERVPQMSYEGWYLQEISKISKTKQGLFFEQSVIYPDSFKITVQKKEVSRKIWNTYLRLTASLDTMFIQSRNKTFRNTEWKSLFG